MARTWKAIMVLVVLVFVAAVVGGLVAAFGGATSTTTGGVISTSGTGAAGAALDAVRLKVLTALADPNLKVADITASKEAPETPEANLVLQWPSGSAEVNTVQGRVYRLSFDRTPPESGAPQPGMDELQASGLEAAQALGWEDAFPGTFGPPAATPFTGSSRLRIPTPGRGPSTIPPRIP